MSDPKVNVIVSLTPDQAGALLNPWCYSATEYRLLKASVINELADALAEQKPELVKPWGGGHHATPSTVR